MTIERSLPHSKASGKGEEGCPSCKGTKWIAYSTEALDGAVEEAMMLCADCNFGAALEAEESRIEELPGGAFVIPSFTDEAQAYTVHPESGYCSCKRHKFRGDCVKHVALAEAIRSLRERRFSTARDEDTLLALAKKVFARVKGYEDAVASYELFLEVAANRNAPSPFVKAAMLRHGRVLAVNRTSEKRRAA